MGPHTQTNPYNHFKKRNGAIENLFQCLTQTKLTEREFDARSVVCKPGLIKYFILSLTYNVL